MTIKSQVTDILGRELETQDTFQFGAMEWEAKIFLVPLIYVGVALGFVLLTVMFFDRFDGSETSSGRIALLLGGIRRRLGSIVPRHLRRGSTPYDDALVPSDVSSGTPQLPPLDSRSTGFRFSGLLVAELRLMFKCLQWWWYVVDAGLIVASLIASPDTAPGTLLLIVWVWPLLIWSNMGVREAHNRTKQLVFSAPHPLRCHLPVTWLSGLIVTALVGSGVLLCLLIDGNADGAAT